mgnify:FL=1
MSGFDHQEIAALLPHRYPFQFVDRVLEFEDGVRIVALKNVSLNEPYFPGHFPDLPVMPGVLICEALAQAGGLLVYRSKGGLPENSVVALTGIEKARFRRPVLPGDQLRLEVALVRSRRPLWKMSGRVLVDGKLVAEADFSLTETRTDTARVR